MDLKWARGGLWASEIFVDSSYIVAAAAVVVVVAVVGEYDVDDCYYYYCMDCVDIDVDIAVGDEDAVAVVAVVAFETYACYCALTVFDAENNDYCYYDYDDIHCNYYDH